MPNTTVPAGATGLPIERRGAATFHDPLHDHRATVARRLDAGASHDETCPAVGHPRLTPLDEFIGLMDLQRRVDRRLDELVVILNPMPGLARRSGAASKGVSPKLGTPCSTTPRNLVPAWNEVRCTLPQSGLALAGSLPGSALFKGGRRHG